jgi:hypothetical protein
MLNGVCFIVNFIEVRSITFVMSPGSSMSYFNYKAMEQP